jgi:hypothetical protein
MGDPATMARPEKPHAPSSARAQIEEQRSSNLTAIPHFDAFASHRERFTKLVQTRAFQHVAPKICILGAGNAYDLDLARLAETCREIHLVDIDETALERAYARHDAATQARLVLHAGADLSGLLERIEGWRQMQLTPDELVSYPEEASERVVAGLPGPFDVVVSACVLTQMQFALVNVLSSSHRLLEATRQLLNVMHLRTLSKLLAPNGCAVLATDLTSNTLFPLSQTPGDVEAVMIEVLRTGRCFHAVRPDLLCWTTDEDPVLRRSVRLSAPLDVWLWQNGEHRTFLVYAAELRRIAA